MHKVPLQPSCVQSPNGRGAVMIEAETALAKLRAISKASAFNEWLGLEIPAASEGSTELQLGWRSEFGQYSGFLHAGLIGALIDTASGFSAATITMGVLASP